jgi:hypothetical protein
MTNNITSIAGQLEEADARKADLPQFQANESSSQGNIDA